ncbi:RHS repeat-associated core domain-containing protein [Flavobacterium sp. ZT3R18]|uniref:DUF6443 domain-containing protein n=1 Tax=Flavobacterium sp. ZT3R18 TaxID=2594429 RepID=UPI00117A94DB|nr:DUF6443 domain-containing protein [Flavobacterium sp. ZT3R18]TRX34058.1 RHS repeat-associated core domain-containing protein [Flavobacterium sp. ZT3R18]
MKKHVFSYILLLIVSLMHSQVTKKVLIKSSLGNYETNGTIGSNGTIGPIGDGVYTWWYMDRDGDGYGGYIKNSYGDVKPIGCVSNNLDCNDNDARITPYTFWYLDSDKDGFGTPSNIKRQCADPNIANGVQYVLNSEDCNDGSALLKPTTVWYLDSDKDGFGTPSTFLTQCEDPSIVNGVQYVLNSTDCNDGDAPLNPNTIWYLDSDRDGFGTSTSTLTQCIQPINYVRNASDCNDGDASLTPNTIWYLDSDHDGFGSSATTLAQCTQPTNYVRNASDCNDIAATINPNTKWYPDTDADGQGEPSSFLQQCANPGGNYVLNNTDLCPTVRGSGTDCESIKAPSLDQNYIITATYKKPTTSVFVNPDPSKAQVNITYFDGLGRPIQQIANQQSNSGKDIITHIGYDDFGRQAIDYLPFASTATNMGYDTNALTNTLSYYKKAIYDNTDNPFSHKKLESSPLNRVLKQAAPGTDWAMDAGHEIKLNYQTNTGTEVKLYKATATWNTGLGLYDIAFSDNGNYGANQLYKTITYDENSAASPIESLGSTVEFKNKEGQVILKRTYELGAKHDTYYVYDSYGNLTYVLPPLVTNPTAQLDGLCYQYKYDNRNRLVEKKLPGKQWEFIVYDKLDRPVATGPVFSPFKGDTAVGWLITKYDVFGRPVYTGWYNYVSNTSTRNSLQYTQNNAAVLFETKQASGTIDGIPAFYTNTVAPTSFKLLTVNYYDNYVFPKVPVIPTMVQGQNVLINTKTLATGSWVRIMTTSSESLGETTAIFYDLKARPINSAVINYLGGYTNTDSKLDSFSGQLQYTITRHKRTTASAELIIKEDFTYSPQGRLLTHTHQINGGAIQLLAANTYDELGQLMSKKVGNTFAAPLQKVDYSYNIRGWLTAINNVDNLIQGTDPKDMFTYKLNYNATTTAIGGVTALYNGNIAETYWRTSEDNVLRSYGYTYDKLNRLNYATYQRNRMTTHAYDENVTYDKNGNIITMNRYGDIDPEIQPFKMDDLVYTYKQDSNQLEKVTEGFAGNKSSGFKDGINTGIDYTYDSNGNLITDQNKGITSISYNHLNLPQEIIFNGNNETKITYIYNALGVKVEKIVNFVGSFPGGTGPRGLMDNIGYLNGFQYKNGVLQFFPHSEGYVKPENGFTYVFNYCDHLGNVRLGYSENKTTHALSRIDSNGFYPFGLQHSGYNVYNGGVYTTSNTVTSTSKLATTKGVTGAAGSSGPQLPPPGPSPTLSIGTDYPLRYQYRFGAKEYQDELGFNSYDFGARNYDPALGRWMNIDPMAEKYFGATPYNYVLNSPVNSIDPDGMDVYLLTESGRSILALKEKGKNTDTMYAVNNSSITDISSSSGTKETTSIFDMKDTNGDGQFSKEDGVTVKSGLIGQLGKASNKGDGSYLSTSEYSKENENNYLSLFKYISDNSLQSEFSLQFFKDGGKDKIQLGTYYENMVSPGANNITKSYHNHSDTDLIDERMSMGDNGRGRPNYAHGENDFNLSNSAQVSYSKYVYFGKSHRLYEVTKDNINYIKKINNSNELKTKK